MAIVTEISYDDMLDGKPLPETPARKAWRDAVSDIAERAKATLPECNGRVDKAVAIVLAGDVELLPDGKAKVASQSNGTTQYFVVNGECSCPDFTKAPSHWCKHRIAAGLAKRAYPLAKAKLEAATASQNGPTEPQPVSVRPPGEPVLALPEAPASANVHVPLAGRKVQVTLRDSDEQRLLARLETLLQRFPAEDDPEGKQAPPEGWCSKHSVQMKLRNGERGSWWSHNTPQGWCKGK
jgi:hypothetical protein